MTDETVPAAAADPLAHLPVAERVAVRAESIAELAARVCRPAQRLEPGPEWPTVDEVDGEPVDMRQVLPAATLRELTAGVGAVLELAVARGADVERQAAWVAAWVAPLLAAHRVEHQDVVQAAQLADLRLQLEQAGIALEATVAEVCHLAEVAAGQATVAQRLRAERDEALRRLRRNEVRVVLDVDTPTIVEWAADMTREKAVEELSNWAAHVRDSFTSVDELLEQLETRLGQLRGGADPGDPPGWPAAGEAPVEKGVDDTPPEVLCDLLSLVGVTATEGQVNGWTADQRREAEQWAVATHLSASDNPVEVPVRPAFLAQGGPGCPEHATSPCANCESCAVDGAR